MENQKKHVYEIKDAPNALIIPKHLFEKTDF